MLKSMTAYSRMTVPVSFGYLVIEIQSVNRKYLEISTALSMELVRFDSDIKKWIAAHVSRGSVTVKINAFFDQACPLSIKPNLPLARKFKEAWDQISEDLNLDPEDGFRLSMLAKEEGILVCEEEFAQEEELREALHQSIERALQNFMEMKEREGALLQKDIEKRLNILTTTMVLIAEKAPGATERYRQKLTQRLEEILAGKIENEEKILREVAVYAEKVDISEEITRFNSHLVQCQNLLDKEEEGGVGKTFEFMLQELNREANTIGSKASDIAVSQAVILIKSELEKIREQVQNVE